MSTYKIVVLGSGNEGETTFVARVGKTSLIVRYVKGLFSGHQISTVDAGFLQKDIKLSDQSVVCLNIWVISTLDKLL